MADEKLVDMKRTAPELKEASAPIESKPSPYPWGLSVRLEEESLAKLGMTTLPKVGSYFYLTARCCVTEISEHDSVDSDGKRQGMSLQLEEMALAPDAEPKEQGPSAAQVMYGSKA